MSDTTNNAGNTGNSSELIDIIIVILYSLHNLYRQVERFVRLYDHPHSEPNHHRERHAQGYREWH